MFEMKIMDLKVFIATGKAKILGQAEEEIKSLPDSFFEAYAYSHRNDDDTICLTFGGIAFAGEELTKIMENYHPYLVFERYQLFENQYYFPEKFDFTDMLVHEVLTALPAEAYYDEAYKTYRHIFSDDEISLLGYLLIDRFEKVLSCELLFHLDWNSDKEVYNIIIYPNN